MAQKDSSLFLTGKVVIAVQRVVTEGGACVLRHARHAGLHRTQLSVLFVRKQTFFSAVREKPAFPKTGSGQNNKEEENSTKKQPLLFAHLYRTFQSAPRDRSPSTPVLIATPKFPPSASSAIAAWCGGSASPCRECQSL